MNIDKLTQKKPLLIFFYGFMIVIAGIFLKILAKNFVITSEITKIIMKIPLILFNLIGSFSVLIGLFIVGFSILTYIRGE